MVSGGRGGRWRVAGSRGGRGPRYSGRASREAAGCSVGTLGCERRSRRRTGVAIAGSIESMELGGWRGGGARGGGRGGGGRGGSRRAVGPRGRRGGGRVGG